MAASTQQQIDELRARQEVIKANINKVNTDPSIRGGQKSTLIASAQKDLLQLDYQVKVLLAQQQVEQGRITQEQAQAYVQTQAGNLAASTGGGGGVRQGFESSVNARAGELSGRDVRTGKTVEQRKAEARAQRNRETYGGPSPEENARTSEELRNRNVPPSATTKESKGFERKKSQVRGLVRPSTVPGSTAQTQYAAKAEQRQEYKQAQEERARIGAQSSALKGGVVVSSVEQFKQTFKQKQKQSERAVELAVAADRRRIALERKQAGAVRGVDSRFRLLSPALHAVDLVKSAPERLLGVQKALVLQGVSTVRGYEKVFQSVNPFKTRLTEFGGEAGRRFFGDFNKLTSPPSGFERAPKSFFTGPSVSLSDPDVREAALTTLTLLPVAKGLRVAAALSTEFAAPVRQRGFEIAGELRQSLRNVATKNYQSGILTRGLVSPSEVQVSDTQNDKNSSAISNQSSPLLGSHKQTGKGGFLSFSKGVIHDALGVSAEVGSVLAGFAQEAIKHPLLAYGAYRVFGAGDALFGKTFGLSVGAGFTAYSVYNAPTGERGRIIVGEGLTNFFLGGGYSAAKTGFARITGAYHPEIITTRGFPKLPREVTFERLKALEGESIPAITGKGAGREFYVGEPKYAGTKGTTGFFSTPVSTEVGGYRVYRYGEFAINPYRNPTYYRNQLKNFIGGKKTIPITQMTFKSPELTLTEYKVGVGKTNKPIKEFYAGKLSEAQRAGQPVTTVAPKTLRGYSQPEEEVFSVATKELINQQMRVRIGIDQFGTPVTKMVPRTYKEVTLPATQFPSAGYTQPLKVAVADRIADFKTAIKTKVEARAESYGAQLRARDLYAKDVAERGLVKYRLIEKGDPSANLIDNSGRYHVETIKKIGRQLSSESNVPVNKNILDAFADVHDINKEPVLNFNVAKAISRGLKKGYYDEVKTVSGLSAEDKSRVARMVVLDEKPPINLGNLFKRPVEMLKYAPYRLSMQEKLVINADRLARFGSRADPDMLFKLGPPATTRVKDSVITVLHSGKRKLSEVKKNIQSAPEVVKDAIAVNVYGKNRKTTVMIKPVDSPTYNPKKLFDFAKARSLNLPAPSKATAKPSSAYNRKEYYATSGKRPIPLLIVEKKQGYEPVKESLSFEYSPVGYSVKYQLRNYQSISHGSYVRAYPSQSRSQYLTAYPERTTYRPSRYNTPLPTYSPTGKGGYMPSNPPSKPYVPSTPPTTPPSKYNPPRSPPRYPLRAPSARVPSLTPPPDLTRRFRSSTFERPREKERSFVFKQPRKYAPTIHAVFGKVKLPKGVKRKTKGLSGLEERPI